MHVFRYMQVYACMQVCKYSSMQEYKNDICFSLSVTCSLRLAIYYLLTESFYLKLAITCKNLFLSLVVVRLVIFVLFCVHQLCGRPSTTLPPTTLWLLISVQISRNLVSSSMTVTLKIQNQAIQILPILFNNLIIPPTHSQIG